MDADNQMYFGKKKVAFSSGENCINKIKKEMKALGYQTNEFEFFSYPLNSDAMDQLEKSYLKQELIEKKDKKSKWTKEDDAYVVYAYQKHQDLPIFHEFMSIGHQFAYDSPDNAPVQAIYSTRGLESLSVNSVYVFTNSKDRVCLRNFEEIATVVQEKYNNLLNDSNYVVTRAKLYEIIQRDQNQNYIVQPVWYFEILENHKKKVVTLVQAKTAKEIFLK